MRLLLVEDDARIARFVAKGLREESYAVDVVANGNDAVYQAEINDYDVVILDVMIPGYGWIRHLPGDSREGKTHADSDADSARWSRGPHYRPGFRG